MKHARGQNKLFQNASHLMCFCNFANGYFLSLKTRFVRRVIEFMFKDQKARIIPRVTQTRVVILRPSHFCELNSSFNGNSHYKSFAIFLSNRRELISNNLAIHSLQRSKRIADEKSKCNQS